MRFYDWCLGIDASSEYDALRAPEPDVDAPRYDTYDALREARSLVRGPLADDAARAPIDATVLRLDTYRRARPFGIPVAHLEPAEIIEMPRDRTAVRKDRRHAG